MGWPWEFATLSVAEKHERRRVLDRYGTYAQLSAFVPLLVILVIRFGRFVFRRIATRKVAYDVVPTSPVAKCARLSTAGSWGTIGRRVAWWLGDDVEFAGQNWGRRDQLVFGAGWAVWLLFLCVVGTGSDYFHLTKRFGIIATSQFPIQYILALKSINPVAFAFRSSHEQINRWHRVLGWITYVLLCFHGLLYINYYIQAGILGEKLLARIVIIGVVSLLGMTLMTTTAFAVIRQYSYRLFFVTHLVVALALPPAIFFHVSHARVYMVESLLVFIVDLAVKKSGTVTAETAVEMIPGTNLIKLVAKVPPLKAGQFKDHAASHIYMSIPPSARPSSNPASLAHMQFEFMFNPFTVAAVDEVSGEITLIARQLKGPVSQTLARFANVGPDSKMPICLEGPYGISKHFTTSIATSFDRVLLFTGGVGATFIMPIYQYLNENSAAHVDMIWAVREAGEATWPVTGTEKSIIDDDNISLYLTGSMFDSFDGNGGAGTSSSSSRESEGVELSHMYKDRQGGKHTSMHSRKRPDLQKIVHDAFMRGQEERVAVLVCGPEAMGRELRRYVGVWVNKGRYVWWHNESFSW
ncbi:ferric reductase like transmembrane component [Pseudomassariella vexata]|uniref:Ferric reductase like transmembrane component n=1 Tax=Pseudomassariella vexata TaxID=1141098 RepID=A0A1Y2DHP9_9PEZI|nr:ferric reductase like transmembrane component [Pseudomassariella vexata]ORY58758.1 ferric reductase like transmembrane component [Pseudomassariella vexata]